MGNGWSADDKQNEFMNFTFLVPVPVPSTVSHSAVLLCASKTGNEVTGYLPGTYSIRTIFVCDEMITPLAAIYMYWYTLYRSTIYPVPTDHNQNFFTDSTT